MICPGTVLYYHDYPFEDGGEPKDKYLIILNNGSCGYYLYALISTKPHSMGNTYGCQEGDIQHNFFLPVGTCDLKCYSWVMLDNFYKHNVRDLEAIISRKTAYRHHIFCKQLAIEVITCAANSDDISNNDREMLFEILENIDTTYNAL